MLIDKTYFVGEINIPNTSGATGEALDLFIQKYEDEFLRKALGYELYKSFKEGLVIIPVDQKWTDLKIGVEYTYSGKTIKWKGLVIQPDTGLKQSPIANYVYYWFMRNLSTQTTVMGEVKTATENSVLSNPSFKMSRAWNEMTNWLIEMRQFLEAKQETYGYEYEYSELFETINVFNI